MLPHLRRCVIHVLNFPNIKTMKFRPSFLFYILAILSLVLIPLLNNETIDINVHDTYFVITFFHYLAVIFILSLFTGFIYTILEKINKPINLKIAISHFTFIVLGLLFSLPLYGLIVICSISGGIPDVTAFASDLSSLILYLIGPLLLVTGLITFIYGLIKALVRKNS